MQTSRNIKRLALLDGTSIHAPQANKGFRRLGCSVGAGRSMAITPSSGPGQSELERTPPISVSVVQVQVGTGQP